MQILSADPPSRIRLQISYSMKKLVVNCSFCADLLVKMPPYIGNEWLVFHRTDGQPPYKTCLNEQEAELRRLLNMPADFVLHTFRHTYGTRLGETGADAFTIMKLMGHSTVPVSQRYVHPSPEAMDDAGSRMEAWNRLQFHGLGTNLGTSESKEIPQVI